MGPLKMEIAFRSLLKYCFHLELTEESPCQIYLQKQKTITRIYEPKNMAFITTHEWKRI